MTLLRNLYLTSINMYLIKDNDYKCGRYMKKNSFSDVPIPVSRALRKLGHDIRDARRRRRIPVAILAERASVSRTTLNKVEKGAPGVSLGIYATVLFVLGMIDRLADIADPRHDSVGLELDEENLPERIRLPRPGKPKGDA